MESVTIETAPNTKNEEPPVKNKALADDWLSPEANSKQVRSRLAEDLLASGHSQTTEEWIQRTLNLRFKVVASFANAQPCVTFDGRTYLYSHINHRSNKLAQALIAFGVKPGQSLGVALARGFDRFVVMLAVLKAGAVWVPIAADSKTLFIRTIEGAVQLSATICDLDNTSKFEDPLPLFRLDQDANERPADLPWISLQEDDKYGVFFDEFSSDLQGYSLTHRDLSEQVENLVIGASSEEEDLPVFAQTPVAAHLEALGWWNAIWTGDLVSLD